MSPFDRFQGEIFFTNVQVSPASSIPVPPGDQGYISQSELPPYALNFEAGNAIPSYAAMGGLKRHYTDSKGDGAVMVGRSKLVGEDRLIFISASVGGELNQEVINGFISSGIDALKGGITGNFEMLNLDGGSSSALAIAKPSPNSGMKVHEFGERHLAPVGNKINNYLRFYSGRPRNQSSSE